MGSLPVSAGGVAPDGPADASAEAAPPYSPARNPFSHARCAGENGAFSGIKGTGGGVNAFTSGLDRQALGQSGEVPLRNAVS
jgi:hypothetical protein